MERRDLGVALFALAVLSSAARADFGEVALAGRAGTLGFGGELMVNFLPTVNGRAGATYFPLNVGGNFGDVNYDFDLRVLTFPLTLDWYPFRGGFHLSGGLIFNQSKMGLDTTSNSSITINGHTYTASEYGAIHGDARFARLAPYIGIGWGNAFGKEGRWGILTDLGVAFLGQPHATLSATGPIAADPTFRSDLAQQQHDIEDDLSILKFYPVASISLFFRF